MTQPQYRTKTARIRAMVDAYLKIRGGGGFTTEEVSEWAIQNGLWPIPARMTDPDACAKWERRLDDLIASCGPVSSG